MKVTFDHPGEYNWVTLTKGIFRKRQAFVVYDHYKTIPYRYKENNLPVGLWIRFRIWFAERRDRRRRIANPWQPIAKLPEAKLLK